jgi:23S rRNA (guanosine2251-2'-O)-methyltransferase
MNISTGFEISVNADYDYSQWKYLVAIKSKKSIVPISSPVFAFYKDSLPGVSQDCVLGVYNVETTTAFECEADSVVLDKNSESRRHQGFIVYTADYKYADFDNILRTLKNKDGNSIVVCLDGILDPHNLGSIIRVCECGGVDALIIPERRSALVTDTVMRISEGGANHVRIAKVVNLNNALTDLKDIGYWVTGAELGGENLYKADLTGKTVLVIGGEGTGIKKHTKEICDRIVTIPLRGKVNSLNASVACGIVLFEALRQSYE